MPRLSSLERLAQFIMDAVIDRHPAIFDRLGQYAACRFLIDIKNMPWVLVLFPEKKEVQVYRRSSKIKADAAIRGDLRALLQLVQGRGDGDALFFNRDITIGGNTEAVLALRNALDDSELDILHDCIDALGFWGRPFKIGYRIVKQVHPIISSVFAR